MRSSLMIEGELPEDGLAALEGNDQDVMLALARRLTDQSESTANSLEALFAQRREDEAENAIFLSGGDWEEAEPAPLVRRDDGTGSEAADRVDTASPSEPDESSMQIGRGPTSRSVSFEELSVLIRRPRSRKRNVPAEQLKLFGD
jgi:hypothetical protein